MSAHATVIDDTTFDLSYVKADLHYLSRMTERPRNYTFDPPPGVPRSNTVHETHQVPIYDLRGVVPEAALDREGFELLRHTSAVQNFYDEDEVLKQYYPEAERLIAEATGASRVFIFDHTVRRRVHGADDRAAGLPRQPATRVHVDHTAKSGPQRVRDFFGDEAEALLRGRVQVINLWRPDSRPVARCPARGLRRPLRRAEGPGSVGPRLPEPSGRDLRGHVQSGASMVLRARHAAE